MQALAQDQLAERLWHQRNRPQGDPDRDQRRAKMIIEQYPFYLAYQVEFYLDDVIGKIRGTIRGEAGSIVLLAVLDGSTESVEAEYERAFRASPMNGAKPDTGRIAAKEGRFRQLCHAHLMDATTIQSHEIRTLPFLDAVVATFSGTKGEGNLSNALSNAVRLTTALANHNQSLALTWESQIHPRLSVANSAELAVANIRYARRGDLILAPSLATQLSCSEIALLRAVGMRSGSSDKGTANIEAGAQLVQQLIGTGTC